MIGIPSYFASIAEDYYQVKTSNDDSYIGQVCIAGTNGQSVERDVVESAIDELESLYWLEMSRLGGEDWTDDEIKQNISSCPEPPEVTMIRATLYALLETDLETDDKGDRMDRSCAESGSVSRLSIALRAPREEAKPAALWVAIIRQRAKALVPIFGKAEPRLIVEMIYTGLDVSDVESMDEAFNYDTSITILDIVNDELIEHQESLRS
jgi:hypothetical protein